MRTSCHLVGLVLILSLRVGAVRAETEQGEEAHAAARTLAQEGALLFEMADFQGSLDKFKQAYDRFPSPKLFLNVGQALRGLSRNVEALEAFERFLAEATDAGPEYQAQAIAQVVELKGKLARLAIACNRPGAVVTIDGDKRCAIPLEKPLAVEPGAHQVTVDWEGETISVGFTAVAGQESSQILNFEEKKLSPEPLVVAPTMQAPEPQILPSIQSVQAQQPILETRAARSNWYWIAGGAVVAGTATAVILLYTRKDNYPAADLGSRTIGP